MRKYLLAILSLCALLGSAQARDPNFIIIFTDDQGYNDLGCFGSPTIRTPHLDQLAADGMKLTDFHVASPVCSPSRAALLTGSYPKRVNMHRHVIFPAYTYGLHPDELTIADHLKAHGYATACVGKWHLGHIPETLPTANGFDSYFGIPYSNDMSHPDNQSKPRNMTQDASWNDQENHVMLWNTPLMRDTEIIEVPVDQRMITRRYTDEAIAFVEANRDRPFFLYLPHSMPHIPLYVPDDVRDPNPTNAYTCVIEHIDTECGRLLKTVRDLGLDEVTYVVFTSDNGPWLSFKHHGGSAGPLRAGKGTTFEGGQRVPCIVRGPGIPAGSSSNALLSTLDLLPTIATLSGHPLRPTNPIDGYDVSRTLTAGATSPRTEFIHYTSQGALEGLRQGDWKLLVKVPGKKAKNPKPQILLFNLADDVGEQTNLVAQYPERVAALRARMDELDAEITAHARPTFQAKL